MPRIWVLPEDIIADIDAMANKLKEEAFPHNGRLHFYSGPSQDVWDLISGDKEKNHEIALRWAERHGETVIDFTPIGLFLNNYEGMGTHKYFDKNPRVVGLKQKIAAGTLPWKHASRLLAFSAHGHLTATSNGAYRKGVYYLDELKTVFEPNYHGLTATEFLCALSTPRKKDVLKINYLPFSHVLDKHNSKGIEAAHTMIQLGAMRMSLHEALETSDPDYIRKALKLASKEVLRSPADAYKYFLDSQERFLVDRALQMKGSLAADHFLTHKTPIVRQKRREERLDQFTSKVLLLIETEIALMPAASRPDFIIPAYVKPRAPR